MRAVPDPSWGRCLPCHAWRLRHRPPASDPEALADYRQTNDPLEPTNRWSSRSATGSNTVIVPAARPGYAYCAAAGANPSHDLLANLNSPVVLANDVRRASRAAPAIP